MSSHIVFLLASFLLIQCSTPEKKKAPVPTTKGSGIVRKTAPKPRVTPKGGQGNAVWYLAYPAAVEIHLEHEKGQKEILQLVETLSEISLLPGSWQVRGLSVEGKFFEPLATGAKFNFQIQKDSPSYLGSYFVECPRLKRDNLRSVKKMEFFNRFPFTSIHGTCELVVGNDLRRVRRAWSTLTKLPAKRLNLGF